MLESLSHILLKQSTTKANYGPCIRLFRSFNSWSIAIRKASTPQEALKLYAQMQRKHVPFDSFTILYTVKACTRSENLPIIRHLHAHVVKLGFSSHVYVATAVLNAYVVAYFDDACYLFDEMPNRNIVTWNTMITGYSRYGLLENARDVFDRMSFRDLSSWAAIISAYFYNRIWNEGLMLFREMVMIDGLRPDQVILGSILAECGRMGSIGLGFGKLVHGFVIKNKWELDVELGTCLVDMYAKCGFLDRACLIFDMMKDRNVVTWTALICGFSQRSCGEEALVIFERMRESGTRPNELTFTGILSSCAQAGLVEDGRRYFRIMEDYGLRPMIQHYGCMVDLFGKAGLLGEAYEVIRMMPSEPNVVIWGSFLASCKLYKQFEMAERVMDWVMRTVRPENDGGVYSLISDLYVLSGKWGCAERLRELMRNQNVRKVRGTSFIKSRIS